MQQYGAPVQYGAPMQPQFGAPVQYGAPAPQMQFQQAPQQVYAAPATQQYAAPQTMQQFAPQQYAAPVQYAAPAQTAPMQYAAPPQVAPVVRQENPVGAEMLQVTVFGTKQLGGADRPLVDIEIAGKPHKHTIETEAITGPEMKPKSLVTYYIPGEHLNFTVSENGQALGDVQISGEDFHPNGLEGDLPLMDPSTGSQGSGYLMVKIVPLGTSGMMAELEPVHVSSNVAPSADPPPVVAGTSAPRQCSPEEYEQLASMGAQLEMGQGTFAPTFAQPQPAYAQPQPTYAQPMPMTTQPPAQASLQQVFAHPQHFAQPQQQVFAQPQPQMFAQPQGQPMYGQPVRR